MEMKRDYAERNRDELNAKRRDEWKRDPTRNKAWVEANRTRVRDYSFKHNLMKRFGVTMEWWRAKVSKQNGVCAICKRPPGKRRLHVDHDHSSGKLRDLLCVNCNHMLGCVNEDPRILMAAIDYLVTHGAPGILGAA